MNPVSHVVEAQRALFAGDPSVLVGTVLAFALAAVALVVGGQAMRRDSA